MGNRAMNIKLTNILKRKNSKERKHRYAKLKEADKDLYMLKINCKGMYNKNHKKKKLQGEENSRRSKQRHKCRANNNRFKKLKLETEKGIKGKPHRTAKAQPRGRGL